MDVDVSLEFFATLLLIKLNAPITTRIVDILMLNISIIIIFILFFYHLYLFFLLKGYLQ